MRSFLTRLLVAVVAIPALLFVFHQGDEWLRFLVVLLMVLGVIEAQGLSPKAGAAFPLAPAVLLTISVPLIAGNYIQHFNWSIWLTLLVLVTAFSGLASKEPKRSAAGVGAMIACVLWIGLGFGALVELRQFGDGGGFGWLLLLFANLWLGDTAAYVFGVWLGQAKLAPQISPKKTIAGSIAQVVASAAVGVVFVLGGWLSASPTLLLAASLMIGVVGQAGDLFESVLKRAAGEKDSSMLIPGHGGVLDRFDSALLAAPSLLALVQAWPR